jgi:membrane protein
MNEGGNDVPVTGDKAQASESPVAEAAESGPKWQVWLERITLVRPLWALYRSYSRRNGPLLSAGIAYYLIFSLAPLTLLTLNIVGRFVDPADAAARFQQALELYLGARLSEVLADLVVNYSQGSGQNRMALISAGILLYGATRLIVRLQTSFNIMWDVRVKPSKFSYRRLWSRLALYGLLLLPSAILLVALALNAGVDVLGRVIGSGIIADVSQGVIAFLVAWGVMTLVFAVMPDIRISVKDCWQGALLTSALLVVGTRVFGAFMMWADNPKYAGPLGSILALIIWADFMAVITLLGVRANRVLYHLTGKVVQPYEYAVIVDETQTLGIAATEMDKDEWARLYQVAPKSLKDTLVAPDKIAEAAAAKQSAAGKDEPEEGTPPEGASPEGGPEAR